MGNLNYTNYDFEDLVASLQNRLKEQTAWKDTYRSGTGQMLLELFAAVGNFIQYSTERRAEESYLATAQNRSSIINLVSLMGYIPQRAVSSSGVLRFSLDAPSSSLTLLPQYTECQTAGGTKYVISTGAAIIAGQTSVDVAAIQGELITSSFTSAGGINQEYNINDTAVENTNVQVLVEGTFWTQVDSFIDSVSDSKHFILRPELNDTVTTVFGNGVFGLSPTVGDSIEVQYIKTLGLAGNVYSTDLITTLNSTIYNSLGNVVSVTVTNTTNFLGGADIESTEEIRYNAPRVFATGDRAVTKDDFVALLNNYPGVADSNAWGENEETPPDVDMYNRVKLVVLLEEWELPDSNLKAELSSYLYDYSLLTIRYTYVDPVILYIVPAVSVTVTRGNDLSYVQAQVENAIEEYFVLGSTTRLGTPQRLSLISASIRNVVGVSYHYLTLKIQQELVSGVNSVYTWSGTVNAAPIKPGSVEVYVGTNKIGADDSSNSITDLSSYYAVTGTIDYTTGFVGINTTPTVTTPDITILYQQDEEGDVIPTKNQICKLLSITVPSIGYAA